LITRPATPEDYERLKEIHASSGMTFPMPDFDSKMIEGIEVVVDERGEIMLAAVAQRTAEIYLFSPKGQLHPVVKMEGIRLLHSSLRDTLADKGYTEFFSFLEPSRERSFGRHLHKWFGWEKTWPAYRVRDWKGEPDAQGRI
jgi:hypothetical protein